MRQLAAAVTVITTKDAGRRAGMTATAVISVTADPPQLAVAVNRSNASYESIKASQIFAINILPHDHADIAGNFAGGAKGDDRFATGEWQELATGAPILRESAAAFDCRLVQTVEFSSHVLFVGEVEAIHVAPTSTPLLYMDGTWASLVRAGEADFAAYESVIDKVQRSMVDAIAGSESPTRQLMAFSRSFAAVSVDAVETLRDFYAREMFAPVSRLESINSKKREVESDLRDLLDRGVSAGEFEVRNTSVTAAAVIGLLNSVHRRLDVSGPNRSEALGEHFSELISSMVERRTS